MPATPHFLDDPELQTALDNAVSAVQATLLPVLPEIAGHSAAFQQAVHAALSKLIAGQADAGIPPLALGPDAFGDRFDLASLPLARPGSGYAVQMLDTDTLLDRHRACFLPVRDPALDGLFPDFDSAFSAARAWLKRAGSGTLDHPLAIVPAAYDAELSRHVLIYGVLTQMP